MEILTTNQLESFAANFDMIKELYDEDDRDILLINFQDQLKKIFSNISSPNNPPMLIRGKIQMWRYNWSVFKKFLQKDYSRFIDIIEGIIQNYEELLESALKNWEKLGENPSGIGLELAKKQQENNTLLQKIEQLEQKIIVLTNSNECTSQQLQKTQDELTSTLELFQQENKAYFHKIISLSKQTADSSIPHTPVKSFRKEITPKVPNNTILMNNRIAQGRELGFKQLKETIEEVYSTKVKFDEKYVPAAEERPNHLLSTLNPEKRQLCRNFNKII